MNLMITPLLDSHGKVRYYLGAQTDTSGLLNDFYGFEHLHQYIDRDGHSVGGSDQEESGLESQDEHTDKGGLQELSELFDHQELDTIRKHGGRLHHPDLQEPSATWKKKRRLVIAPEASSGDDDDNLNQLAHGEAIGSWNDEDEPTRRRRTRTDSSRDGSSSNSNNMISENKNNNHTRRPGSSAARDEVAHDRIMSPGYGPIVPQRAAPPGIRDVRRAAGGPPRRLVRPLPAGAAGAAPPHPVRVAEPARPWHGAELPDGPRRRAPGPGTADRAGRCSRARASRPRSGGWRVRGARGRKGGSRPG